MMRFFSSRLMMVAAAAAIATSRASAPAAEALAESAKQEGKRGAWGASDAGAAAAATSASSLGLSRDLSLEHPAPSSVNAAVVSENVLYEAGGGSSPQWRGATTLGLQRGFHVKKAPALFEEEDPLEVGATTRPQWRDATTFGLQRGFHIVKAPPPFEEEDPLEAGATAGPQWRDATTLGLQRGFHVAKAPAPLEDPFEVSVATNAADVSNEAVAGDLQADDVAAPSWLDATALGLQSGFRVQKKAWTPSEDAPPEAPTVSVHAATTSDAVAAGLHMTDDSPSWLEGAALGLQRGFRVQKKAWPPDAHDEDAPANAFSIKLEKDEAITQPWLGIAALGLQRGFRIVKKLLTVVEETPSGVALQGGDSDAQPREAPASVGQLDSHNQKIASTTFREQKLDDLSEASNKDLIEEYAIPWHEATALGLQRAFQLQKKMWAPEADTERETATTGGLSVGDSTATLPNKGAPFTSVAAAPGSKAGEGSVRSGLHASAIGLQQVMRVQKKASQGGEEDTSRNVFASIAGTATENKASPLPFLQAVNSTAAAWNRTRQLNATFVFV